MNLIRISMFRSDNRVDGKLLGLFPDEDEAKDYINRSISEALVQPVKLRWKDGSPVKDPGKYAESQPFKLKSFKFEDTEKHDYFLWADDYERHAARCTCGMMAVLTYGYSGFRCDFCNVDFYLNECWACGRIIDSRVRPRCGCGYYICTCGACSCQRPTQS